MEVKLSTVVRFLMKECMEEYQLLLTIPGISDNGCATILAEIGPTIDAFKTDNKLASWAGMCPDSNESAGGKKIFTHDARQ